MKGRYVFAALVAAGVAGIFFFGGIDFPPKNDDAAGTIGAVKKHRAEQIAEGDVVLGATEGDTDWVPFAEFLGDAGALGNASARLDAISRSLAARDALDAKVLAADLKAVDAILEARAAQLDARALEAMRLQARQLEATVDAKSRLDARSSFDAGAALDAKRLDAKRLDAMRLDAKNLSIALQARDADVAGARDRLAALARELSAASRLDARTLDAASRLDAFSKTLQAKDALDAKIATADLGAISASLAARNADLAARTLDARDAYIESAIRPQADLAGARTQLGALASQLEASSRLDAKSLEALNALSAQLQARAAELEQRGLAGMRGQLEFASRDHEALMGMKASADLAARSLDARDASVEARTGLGAIDRELSMKSLEAASRLGAACRNDIGAIERTLAARDAAFGAKTLDAMNAHLGSLSRTLQARAAQLEAKQLEAIERQLGSVSQTLQARTPEAR